MTYTITITDTYEYPLNPVVRDNLYVEKLMCVRYVAYADKNPNSTFTEYLDTYLSNLAIKVDKINPQYVQKGRSIELANGKDIDNETAPPLVFSWWDEGIDTSRADIDGVIQSEYNIHIVFSGESSDKNAKRLKNLCDNFIATNRQTDDKSASYSRLTETERVNYEGFIDKIVDVYQGMKIWKFNSAVADSFINRVEKEYKPISDPKAILITKLFNKL